MGARFAILGAAHVERGGSAELKEDQHGIPVTIAASAPDGCQELRGFSFAELLDIGQRRARLRLSNVRRSIRGLNDKAKNHCSLAAWRKVQMTIKASSISCFDPLCDGVRWNLSGFRCRPPPKFILDAAEKERAEAAR